MKHNYVTWFGETFCVNCFLEKTGGEFCQPDQCPGCYHPVEKCRRYDECGTYHWERKYFKLLYQVDEEVFHPRSHGNRDQGT